MSIDDIEKRIDEALEKGNYEILLELLEERRKLLETLPKEALNRILIRDKERLEKLEKRKSDLFIELTKTLEAKTSLQKHIWLKGDTIGKG
ncbi:flagellar protein FliT [Thermotoga sp. KOL6]|uniref:flagellar protein FliT n=1 Tax=Thermotoga sp. KOL6 TaxID=126741 RepID=UPI000C777B17|nr:flagellar protein FliT [Thermotoga sp. KOL6]PLV59394.1 hypothetical protein AS005_06550 [Thermotoga sp. KOL6]